MTTITKELNKKFNKKFDYLRLLDVTYDKDDFSCVISFLFPQTVSEITDESREEIYNFLKEYLNLNAKLVVKYKKSFLDEDLIKKSVFNFFKINNYSLFSSISEENVSVSKDLAYTVNLSLPNEFNEYIERNQIQNNLKLYLEKEFIGEFYVDLRSIENDVIDDSVLDMRKMTLPKPIMEKVKRYEVFTPAVLLGREISPFPEIIREQKELKSQVILAGKISNVTKREFKSKRNKDKDVMNHFYTFELNDSSATIPCIYFSSKSNEVKLDKLVKDISYLFQGDIRENTFGKKTFHIRYINYCSFNPELVKNALDVKQIKTQLKDYYQYVSPKPYFNAQQEKLFDNVEYNELIMQNDIVVFDVETTGLDAENCEIIEIGACKVVKGKITEIFQNLVKPKRSIPDLITNITSIDNEMVKDAPSIDKVLTDFILFSKNCVLSGYNVGFDMKFIQNAGKEIDFTFENRVEDAMAYAREQLFIGNYTLKNVAKHLEVSLNNAHRALNDALATANVLLKLNIKQKI